MFTTSSFNFIQNYLADAQTLRLEIMEIAKHLLRSQSKVPVTSAMFSVHPTVMIWMMRRPLVTRRSSILHKHALLVSVLEQSFLSNQKLQYLKFTIYKISSYKINFSKPNLVKCKGKDGGCEGADTDVTKHYCRDGVCTRKYFDSEVIKLIMSLYIIINFNLFITLQCLP